MPAAQASPKVALGQQRGGLHLGEHVQVIVAGGAVGAEATLTRPEQSCHRTVTGGELQIRLRAQWMTLHRRRPEQINLSSPSWVM